MIIYKYPLHAGGDNILNMPQGSTLLCVQQQGDIAHGNPCLWAQVDPTKPMVKRVVTAICTGQGGDIPVTAVYVSTVQLGWFVVHFYDLGEQP